MEEINSLEAAKLNPRDRMMRLTQAVLYSFFFII